MTMVRSNTVILWDCNGKIEATLFASSRKAFDLTRVNDQMGMIAVKVTTTVNFDAERDYVLRVVNKNGQLENQLVFGTLPSWAGGSLVAPRCLIADGKDTTRLLAKFPAQSYHDAEVRRHNGIRLDDDENCEGK
jgi:hypothetical protein